MFFLFFLLPFLIFSNPTGISSEPFISGDTWRHRVDHILSDVESFSPNEVKKGDIIFVEQDSLTEFFNLFIPNISAPYILITANCDRGGDEPMPGKFEAILEDKNLKAWFTQNIDRNNHPKLYPIPIGLANRKYPWGEIEKYIKILPNAQNKKRTKWLYINFNIKTNKKIRKPIWKYFSNHSLNGMVHLAQTTNQSKYMDEISHFKFVLSPPGNGLDCHRTWESLLLGTYPIVLSSTLNPLYRDLPVLIINKWEEITPNLLKTKYKEFKSKQWNLDKLYFKYWLKIVKSKQDEIKNSHENTL